MFVPLESDKCVSHSFFLRARFIGACTLLSDVPLSLSVCQLVLSEIGAMNKLSQLWRPAFTGLYHPSSREDSLCFILDEGILLTS